MCKKLNNLMIIVFSMSVLIRAVALLVEPFVMMFIVTA